MTAHLRSICEILLRIPALQFLNGFGVQPSGGAVSSVTDSFRRGALSCDRDTCKALWWSEFTNSRRNESFASRWLNPVLEVQFHQCHNGSKHRERQENLTQIEYEEIYKKLIHSVSLFLIFTNEDFLRLKAGATKQKLHLSKFNIDVQTWTESVFFSVSQKSNELCSWPADSQ